MQIDHLHTPNDQTPCTGTPPGAAPEVNSSINSKSLAEHQCQLAPDAELKSSPIPLKLTKAETLALQKKLSSLIVQTHEILGVKNTTNPPITAELAKHPCNHDALIFLGEQQLSDQQIEQLQSEPQVRLRQIRPSSQLSRPKQKIPVEGSQDDNDLHQKLICISDMTKQWMSENISDRADGDWQYKVCHWTGSKRHIQIHIKQHMVQMYCKCYYNRISRNMVYDHQVSMMKAGIPGHGPRPGHIFEVHHSS